VARHQYVFRPHDPFPCRPRRIFMATPANDGVPRSVFRRDELTWIDGAVADTMSRPETWVKIWTNVLGLRADAIRVDPARTGSLWGFLYDSNFLAPFAVHQQVMARSLRPENRPALAVEFRHHPSELELLKGDDYTCSAVNGVLAENGGPPQVPAPPSEPLVRCDYCGSSYKQGEPRCTHCGARRE